MTPRLTDSKVKKISLSIPDNSAGVVRVTEYIRERCEGNSFRGRPPEGARLLSSLIPYGHSYDKLSVRAISGAVTAYQKSRRTSSNPFKLTVTSTAVGLQVLSALGVVNTNYHEIIAVGDLYLEAFLQLGYISIGRAYKGYRAPYIIELLDTWAELGDLPNEYKKSTLIGTSFTPPKDISSLRNEFTNRPYIKRMSSEADFKELIGAPFVKALNKLQQTPWRLNSTVAKALESNLGLFIDPEDESVKAKSKAIEMKFVMAKIYAIGLRDFYQMVECDYRGRVYYTEPFLNFQGSDVSKGLFEFAYTKVMNTSGYKWLCIHTACSYNQSYEIEEIPDWATTDYKTYLQDEGLSTISVDKMTLKDRELWTLHNLTWINQLADGQTFRMESEKPVSFLACCLEVKGYNDSLKDGTSFMSRIPIPVDGSNNGWQHLAAISKDKQAGELVSLVPSEIQKDFYVQVAKRLIERMPEWFAERNIPMKAIRKGIAKRGAMTRAYSAGQKKIAANMFYDCKVEGYDKKYNITEDDCTPLSKQLILAINDTCVGPLKTMKFIQKITDHILSTGKTCTQWTTPSGFPVLYEVWRQKNITIRGMIRGVGQIGHSIKIPVITAKGDLLPCRRSFASGCSPNFVHSMDAAHMAKVIESFSGDFGAIHDSYSTHSCDVDKLVDHTKWQFGMLYNGDNFFTTIEDMLLETREGYELKQPELGDLEISEIISSDYFFC
jgi:DNA-directed RNA polymerase